MLAGYSLSIFFLFLANILALGIILFRNPVYCILFFIITILSCSFSLFSLGLDFLGLVLLIIYVGSISVLFLFLVMMLNIKILELSTFSWRYTPIGFFLIICLIFVFFTFLDIRVYSAANPEMQPINYTDWLFLVSNLSLLRALGSVLYSFYLFFFIYISVLLFFAMISSIALTLNQNLKVKRQNIYDQCEKSLTNSIFFTTSKKSKKKW